MNSTDIIHAFSHNPPGIFPKEAIQAAMDSPEDNAPALVELLQKGADDIVKLASTKADNGFLYAMFLLAQFEEEQGLQPLIDFFCTEGMTAIMLTGDVVTENLNKLFAGMARRNHAPLLPLIENPEENSFVRAAAIEALLSLVAWGDAHIEDIEDYFKQLLTTKLEKEPSHVWNYLSDAASRLGSERLLEPLELAYNNNLASDTYIPWSDAQERLRQSPQETKDDLKNDPGLAPITNVIDEMQDWACFTPVEERMAPIKIPKTPQPVQSSKIGRNDLCSCGSGKKYKKCCMGN